MYNKNQLINNIMKKLISFLTALIIFIIPFSYVSADTEINFLKALLNTNELKSYKILQNISGNFKVEEYGDVLDGNFRLSFSGNVNNDNAYENKSSSRVTGYAQINHLEGENKSFDKLTINFNGEIISIFSNGIYLRLNDIKINGTGISQTDLNEINDFLLSINEFKNQWYKIPTDILTNNVNEKIPYNFEEVFAEDLINSETLAEYFQGNDIKTNIGEILKTLVSEYKKQGYMANEEYDNAIKAIDLIINTNFFNKRDIVSGRNTGFKFFTFNKASIINLIKNIANIFGKTIEDYELAELRSILSKFNLAGIYRINTEYDVIDNLLVKLTLRNLEELTKCSINYRYKISNFNNAPKIKAPADYIDIEETGIYIPYINDNYHYNDWEYEDGESDELECIECEIDNPFFE